MEITVTQAHWDDAHSKKGPVSRNCPIALAASAAFGMPWIFNGVYGYPRIDDGYAFIGPGVSFPEEAKKIADAFDFQTKPPCAFPFTFEVDDEAITKYRSCERSGKGRSRVWPFRRR